MLRLLLLALALTQGTAFQIASAPAAQRVALRSNPVMALPSIEDARKLSDSDLEAELFNAQKELFELRKAREESTSPEGEVVSAEFDVLFESHEKMAIDIAGQSLVVEKKQLSTWRFLSPLDEPEWRVCKIF